ncbi:ankyrin repeat domain-containing protein [Anaerostipes sp.]|uniref:ankyrin repeat domain-containing protein n=1 Tax=Anaerostipes sp. TaxID=1872530 RepID=UPI0025BC4E29|nr:ankyrin repeat domain-containing protein [Anaerostipes sp.]MBS7009775.1 ankyrin repeat domain-containing protein [Anaerostipes sp.]
MKKIPAVHKRLAAVLLFILMVGCFLLGVLHSAGKRAAKKSEYKEGTVQYNIFYNKKKEIKRMVSQGLDLNDSSQPASAAPLIMAIDALDRDRMYSMVAFLIEQGAEVNSDYQTDSDIVFRRRTPLYEAISFGDTKLVRQLLKAGASADYRDKDGTTPLMFACFMANGSVNQDTVDNVRTLLYAGADPSAVNQDGKTAEDYFETGRRNIEADMKDSRLTDEEKKQTRRYLGKIRVLLDGAVSNRR